MTARETVSSINSTPASRMRLPPRPTRWRSGRSRASVAATGAAFRSPDVSPAEKRTSRTGQRRERALDLTHDPERDRQRIPPVLAAHRHGLLAPHRADKALELELERLGLGRGQRDPFDELLDRLWRGGEARQVDVFSQAIEHAGAGAEVEREIPARLKNPELAQLLPRDATRRNIGDRPGREGQSRV